MPAQNRSICRARVCAQEHLGRCRIQRTGTNGRFARAGTRGKVQEVAAVRQKMRETMCDLGTRRIEGSHRLGCATRRGNLVQDTHRPRAEHDDSFGTPGASPAHHDVGDISGGPSADLDGLQLVRHWKKPIDRLSGDQKG